MIIGKSKSNNTKHQSGFTLIELSIVILIFGIIIIPLIQMYINYNETKKVHITKENVKNALANVNGVVGRSAACPANLSLPETSPLYGAEVCDLTTIPVCDNTIVQGICRFQTAIDRDGDTLNDWIVIGGVPSKIYTGYTGAGAPIAATISNLGNLNATNILDGWGRKLTYAVSQAVMMPAHLNPNLDYRLGVISAIDEFPGNNPTAGVNNDAQYVVLSHGKDGSGAFSSGGVQFNCIAGSTQTENCDKDSIFVQGLGYSEGALANRYDDVAMFFMRPGGELWANIQRGTVSTNHIINRNTRNVGVNMGTDPVFKLQVNGTLAADTVRTDDVCGPDATTLCFNPNIFNSLGIGTCPPGQIMTQIANRGIRCSHPTFNAPAGESRTCPGTSYITSIQTNGCIGCSDGSLQCAP